MKASWPYGSPTPVRIDRVRKMGGVVFFDGYPWITGYDVERKGPMQYMFEKSTAGYDTLSPQLHPGTIVFIEEKEKDDRGRIPVKILRLISPQAFPRSYPSAPILDKEIRYKDPVLDALSNRSRVNTLIHRSLIEKSVSGFFDDMGFIRISTPVLQENTGGGSARPFETHANYNGKRYYLRSCHEYPGKKLIAMGLDRVYVMGPTFRNQDLGRVHCFEFQSLEAYYTVNPEQGFSSLTDIVERLYTRCYLAIHGHTILDGCDLSKPWPVISWRDLIPEPLTPQRMSQTQHKIKHDPADMNLPPFFHLAGVPEVMCPLAASQGGYSLGFESFVKGVEVSTCYVEETCPKKLHAKWILCQQKNMVNDDFMRVLSYGLPPTAGLGVGIDRIVYTILRQLNPDLSSLREIRPFPFL